jgi:hypothetical protein
MIRLTMTAVALVVAGSALAKLPPPDEAAKAKAAETAAKSAWQAKFDAFLLCKAQDRVAAKYKSASPQAKAPAAAASGAPAMTQTAAPAAAASAPATAAKPPTPTAATASQGGSTPVATVAAPAAATTPPCTDPGAFAYAPPEQKPLEASGAHSPAPTAASAPSVRTESGAMTSGKTGGPAKP